MNYSKYRHLFLSIVLLGALVNGCGGGGGTTPPSDNGGQEDPSSQNSPVKQTKNIKYSRVSIAGSSITHGGGYQDEGEEGYLGEHSYVGQVEKYLREEVADTLNANELLSTPYVDTDLMSYLGKINIYPQGSVITGTLKESDEIAIVYAGNDEETTIELEVDGKIFSYTIPAGNYSPVKKVYDDTNVNFYKAFRETNPKAVKVWKLPKTQNHQFKITVKSGELHLNFVTNHMFYMQNAGVSGFEAEDFLSEYRTHSTVRDIIDFNPDLFIFESSTNDAKTWRAELDGQEESTNQWLIENPVNFSSDGNVITLPQTVSVREGDVVVMGDYQGDIQNMAVGIVANAGNGNRVTLSKVVSYEGQAVHEQHYVPSGITKICRIKRISTWEDRVKEVIRKVKIGTGNNNMLVGIGTSGVPNYYNPASNDPYTSTPYTPRRLLGYRERGEMIAQENGWFFVDFFKNTLAVEPGVDIDRKWSMGDNTHPNPQGRILFGNAVISQLAGKLK